MGRIHIKRRNKLIETWERLQGLGYKGLNWEQFQKLRLSTALDLLRKEEQKESLNAKEEEQKESLNAKEEEQKESLNAKEEEKPEPILENDESEKVADTEDSKIEEDDHEPVLDDELQNLVDALNENDYNGLGSALAELSDDPVPRLKDRRIEMAKEVLGIDEA